MFMLALDLDELDTVFKGPGRLLWSVGRWNVSCLLRKDHFGDPGKSIKEAVQDRVEEAVGDRPARIVMLAHLRTFGYVMNPATFFYCYGTDDRLAAIAVEIHNTPWGERHVYVLPIERQDRDKKSHRFKFEKAFHVSPFMPMDHDYDWRFNDPAPGSDTDAKAGGKLIVSMKNLEQGRRVFDASLSMTAKPITSARLNLMLLKHPLITVKVIVAIYWNALLLWLKRVPFVDHPKWSDKQKQ